MGEFTPRKWHDVPFTPVLYWDYPRTKKAAKRQKVKVWFDGSMCDLGHVAPHYVSNNACVLCVQAAKYTKPSGAVPTADVDALMDELTERRINGERRKVARENGERFYEAAKPHSCGCTMRYTTNGYCVDCTRKLNQKAGAA